MRLCGLRKVEFFLPRGRDEASESLVGERSVWIWASAPPSPRAAQSGSLVHIGAPLGGGRDGCDGGGGKGGGGAGGGGAGGGGVGGGEGDSDGGGVNGGGDGGAMGGGGQVVTMVFSIGLF